MKKTSIVISILLLLLAIPALSHVHQAPAAAQITRNTALYTDSVIMEGTVDVSLIPDASGPSAANPLLSLIPPVQTQPHTAGPALTFRVLDLSSGSSYINVAKSIEGTPG